MKKFLFAFIFLIPSMAHAQYVQVATANQTVAITGSVTTFARYGSVKDNLWFYKAYSTKTFVVGSKEFTVSPDPAADPSTLVLEVFQVPAVSNFSAPTITVNSKAVIVPPAGTTTPPINSQPGTMGYCNSGLAKSFTFNGTGTPTNFTTLGIVCN